MFGSLPRVEEYVYGSTLSWVHSENIASGVEKSRAFNLTNKEINLISWINILQNYIPIKSNPLTPGGNKKVRHT